MKRICLVLLLLYIAAQPAISQCGTTNIAQGKTMLFKSEDQNHTAALAVDGSLPSLWWPNTSSTPDDQWLTVDLGQNYAVCQVKVIFEDATHHAANYNMAVSTDNSNWTQVANVTGNSLVTITHNIYNTCRYVRVWLTLRAVNWSAFAIREIQIFNNQAPAVSITSPSNNASFTAGDNIVINATATDADGTVSKVEFFQGTTKLGEDLISPYTYTWNNVSGGSYSLTAVATDNLDAVTTSAPVNITVVIPPSWSLTGNPNTNTGTHFIGTTDDNGLIFKTNNTVRMLLSNGGSLGINTTQINNDYKLFVEGSIRARNVRVDPDTWPDYVFYKNYKLPSLAEIERFIQKNNHLPGIPSATEVKEKGLDVGNNHALLLKKIEELTLYVIELNKKMEKLSAENVELKKTKAANK